MDPTPPTGREQAEPGTSLAHRVAAAVRAVPAVHDLHAGPLGEVATLLPGERVAGVRLRDDLWEVHVSIRWGNPVAATAQQVRTAVAELAGTTPVDVVVEDVVREADHP